MNRKDRRRLERLGETPPPPEVGRAPNLARAKVLGAEKRLETGDREGARKVLDEAAILDPGNARAHFLLAMLDFEAEDMEAAGEHILEAALADESDVLIHTNCATIMNRLGRAAEAEAAARFAIDLDGDVPEAHCALGIALDAQEKTQEARGAFERAAKLRPGYLDALINLGTLLFRQGDMVSAVESYAAAVKAEPGNPMPRTNLAIALRRLGELAAAEEQCLAAIELAPAFAEAHNALGNVRRELGDLPGAIAAFQAALDNRPDYAEAAANLAAARFKAGDLAAAGKAYEALLERHPDFAEASLGLGVVRLAEGNLIDAETRFRATAKARPSFGEAWMNIVGARGKDISDEDIDVIRRKAGDASLAPQDRIAFLFALGEALDAKGDHEGAFAAFADGNARRRARLETEGRQFAPDEFDGLVSSVISTLDKATVDRLRGISGNGARMLFIVGMPRSGTTLLEQMAARHPNVVSAGEADVLAGLVDDYPADAAALAAETAAELAAANLTRLGKSAPADGWLVDKTPLNAFYLGLIAALFPNARAIHCRRDRRDVAISTYFQNFKADHPWSWDLDDIRRYGDAQARIMAHWTDIAAMPILDIDYEDVVAAPEAAAKRIVAYLDLPWDDACAHPDGGEGAVLTASNWQVRKPVHTGSVGRWRHYEKHLGMFSAEGDRA